jgi:hypothetical protein
MAIAFNAASSTGDGAVTLLSQSHTAAGSDRCVIIGIHAEGGVSISSLAYGAQTPTLIGSHSNTETHLYRLVAPNTGAQTVTVNFSGSSSRCAMGILSYTGVDQVTPVGTMVQSDTSTDTVSVDATSAAGQLVVDFAMMAGGSISVGPDQTARIDLDDWASVNRSLGMSDQAGAATVTMSWTAGGVTDGFILAVPLIAAAGAGGGQAARSSSFLRLLLNN